MNTRQLVALFLGLFLAVVLLTVEPYQREVPVGRDYSTILDPAPSWYEPETVTFVDSDRNGILLAIVLGTTIGLVVALRDRDEHTE